MSNAVPSPSPNPAGSRKRSMSDLIAVTSAWSGAIDASEYNDAVLQLPQGLSEDAFEQRLVNEAAGFGLDPGPIQRAFRGEDLAPSLSTATIGSETDTLQSRQSHSTEPTSCDSSDRRQALRKLTSSSRSRHHSASPSIRSAEENRSPRHGLRASLKRMTVFRRRKSDDENDYPVLASIDANTVGPASHRSSCKAGTISPSSAQSYISTSSSPTMNVNEMSSNEDDEDSIKRTMNAAEMRSLREQQLLERARFLVYQRRSLSQLREQHKLARQRIHDAHEEAASEMEEKNALAADDLESRQLEAEAKFRQDLEAEKRACLIRLRHMEAYCHTPSPPITPRSDASGSQEQLDQFPERKVTDRDFSNLAAQYRERDTMDGLHQAKLEVMHGRQEKVLNAFVKRKEKELATLIANHEKTEAQFSLKCDKEEQRMIDAFKEKTQRLRLRWTLQGQIQACKLEQRTGLHHAAPPALSVDCPAEVNGE